jgi:hypothetical protein
MPIDKATALTQIDTVLQRWQELLFSQASVSFDEVITLACATINRLAPPGSAYLDHMQRILADPMRKLGKSNAAVVASRLEGVLKALRADYESGCLQTFQELVHADLFSDFLEMAEYFLEEGYKDPAAVMAGGVLEEHLRKLCQKHGITLAARPKLDTMNADLAKAGAYGKNEQKQVTAWAGIRNEAAHANYGNYSAEQVKLMVAGIRDFITRNPA